MGDIMKIKAAQIARDLGLSKATVSLALNNKPGVSEQTRQEIFHYIQEIENPTTKNEVQFIKIIRFEDRDYVFGGEVDLWSEVLNELNKEAKKDNYSLSIDYVDHNETAIDKLVAECNGPSIAGVIIFADEMKICDFERFKRIQKPMLIYDNDFDNDNYSSIMIDHEQAFKMIFQYLQANGFQEVSYLANKADHFNFRKRRETFKKCLNRYGFKGEIFEVGMDVDSVYKNVKERLIQHQYSKVMISENYQVSIGVIKAVHELNMKFKEDVCLIGIDEIPEYFCYGHCLTTIKIAHGSRAKMAIKLLKEEINGDNNDKFKIYSTCKFIPGDTM